MGWMAVAAPIVMGVAQIAGGIAQKNSYDAAAKWSDFNAGNARIAGDQQEAQRRADLNSTISAARAVRAARGLDIASPTGMALEQSYTLKAETGIANEQLNARGQAGAAYAQSSIYRAQGTAAMLGGFIQGGQSLFQAGGKAGLY